MTEDHTAEPSYVFAYAVYMTAQQRFGLGLLLRAFTDWANSAPVQEELSAWIDAEMEDNDTYKGMVNGAAIDYVAVMDIPESHSYHPSNGGTLIEDVATVLAVLSTMPPEHHLVDQVRSLAVRAAGEVSALQGLAGYANTMAAGTGGVLSAGLTFDTVVINLAVAMLQGRSHVEAADEVARVRDENPVLAFNTRGRWDRHQVHAVGRLVAEHLPEMGRREVAYAETVDLALQLGLGADSVMPSETGADYYRALESALDGP